MKHRITFNVGDGQLKVASHQWNTHFLKQASTSEINVMRVRVGVQGRRGGGAPKSKDQRGPTGAHVQNLVEWRPGGALEAEAKDGVNDHICLLLEGSC